MPGTFIISLDCEDYWGIADNDRAVATNFITESSVVSAYDSLVKALALYEIPATSAYPVDADTHQG